MILVQQQRCSGKTATRSDPTLNTRFTQQRPNHVVNWFEGICITIQPVFLIFLKICLIFWFVFFFCLARSKNTATEITGEYFEPASLSCSLNVRKYLRCQIAKKCIHNGTSLFFFFINIYTQLWGSGSLSDKVQYYHSLWSFLSITRSSGRKACSRGIYLKSG